MSVTIKKVFFAWQMEKERKWLEQKAKEGLILSKLGLFRYTFEETKPRDIVYQFDFQIMHKDKEDEYLEIFQDWHLVQRFGGWYYFYKERQNDETDYIYSDNDSKSQMFTRLLGFLCLVGFPLYYQIIILMPNMDPADLEFPKFYFFFRIIVLFMTMLHLYALVNVFLIYRSFKKMLKQ